VLPLLEVQAQTAGPVVIAKAQKAGPTLALVDSRFLSTSKMVPTLFSGYGSLKEILTREVPTARSKVVLISRSKAVNLARSLLVLYGKAATCLKLVKVFALTLPSTTLLSKVSARMLTHAKVVMLLVYPRVSNNAWLARHQSRSLLAW